MRTKYTAKDVERKAALIDAAMREAGKDGFYIQSTNPAGTRRYEFAGWVYMGAGEACRALDAMLVAIYAMRLSAKESEYVARAIDVARSDERAAALLSPVERDELLRKFGGRREA